MIEEDEIIQIERDPWIDNLFRPFMITVMIMCLNISLVNLVRLGNPAWRGSYFLIAMFLTTVEAIYSYRVLQRYGTKGISKTRYRLAEWLVLILIIKLLSFMGKPLPLIGAELQMMWLTPTTLFVNTEFFVSLVLALMAWSAATQTIADFDTFYDPYVDNRATLDSLTERFFMGGILLMLISGVTQWISLYGLRSLIDWQRPGLGGVVLNVLIYFTFGLILLSQVNLSRLVIRWRIQKMAPPPEIAKRWAKYGLIFLGLVMFVAFLLPTRYTLGFLDVAGIIVRFLIDIFLFIFQLLLLLLTLPLSWLLSLFGISDLGPGETGRPQFPPRLDTSPGASYPWLDILRSLIFWLAALAIIGYLLKTYLDDHPEIIESFKKFKPFRLMLDLLGQLWALLKDWTQAGLEMLPKNSMLFNKRGSGRTTAEGRGWLGLRNLSARDRILYYYLNLLDQAKKHGPSRRGDQTPYEYEPNLKQSVPDVQGEIHDITDIFVRARYSRNRFSDEQAALVKWEWQQIKKALKRKL
jgi:hypothetical protein